MLWYPCAHTCTVIVMMYANTDRATENASSDRKLLAWIVRSTSRAAVHCVWISKVFQYERNISYAFFRVQCRTLRRSAVKKRWWVAAVAKTRSYRLRLLAVRRLLRLIASNSFRFYGFFINFYFFTLTSLYYFFPLTVVYIKRNARVGWSVKVTRGQTT
jgi:hypothetical protein